MMKISSLIVAFSLYIMVLVNSSQQQQLSNTTATCNFTAWNSQRTPCSSNSDCECFSLTTKPGSGICAAAAAVLPCTSVVRCNADNRTCPIDNTVCVNSTRCGKPVCYPVALANELVCPAVPKVWSNTGNMTTSRAYHTASVLNNGKVLVSGGYKYNVASWLNSAELYDPSTGIWTTTGNMTTYRYSHTASVLNHTTSVLNNGKVLVTGGYNIGYLNSAELYDPSTGIWRTTTSNMKNTRVYHTASVLNNGKVLVTGGYNNNWLNGTELYDPSTGTWTLTGNMKNARAYHTASVLNNGKVLVTGGYHSVTYLNSAELYDPSTGIWTTTGNMTNARREHTASVLSNGKVLVSGGDNGSSALNSGELYDPSTGIWTSTGNMTNGREYHTASVLNNGKVLVSGGEGKGGVRNTAELY